MELKSDTVTANSKNEGRTDEEPFKRFSTGSLHVVAAPAATLVEPPTKSKKKSEEESESKDETTAEKTSDDSEKGTKK